jgi:hypothetical protein
MRRASRIAVAVVLASLVVAVAVAPCPAQAIVDADKLFQAGKFAEAGAIYAQIVAHDPKNQAALAQLGYIALLANHLDEADRWLKKAIALNPSDAKAHIMLAEVFYRRDDFPKAAELLREVGPKYSTLTQNYSSLNLEKLESFRLRKPYEVTGKGESTRLKFVKVEPLPVLNVRINGGPEVTFFLDTGGSELLLDTEFAKELGIKPLGAVQGTFSGGQHADVQNGRIDSLTLGDWQVKNVPVGMLPLRAMSADFGVKQLNGCVGTNVLYHFLATIDYPHGELILRKKTAAGVREAEDAGDEKPVSVPVWMAGDRFMVGWGQIEANPPALLLVDSGLTGAEVKLGEAAIKAAAIKLDQSKASQGAGGGGNLKIVPYSVKHVSFGDIKEENVEGLYDGLFPWEHRFGFYLAGMIGHDFLKKYAVTLDFDNMRVLLQK